MFIKILKVLQLLICFNFNAFDAFYLVLDSGAQRFFLELVSSIGGCLGGQICSQQPTVKLMNSQGFVAQSFTGIAFVQMGKSPSGFEALYFGSCQSLDVCGVKSIGSNINVPFIDGYATFSVGSMTCS